MARTEAESLGRKRKKGHSPIGTGSVSSAFNDCGEIKDNGEAVERCVG